MANLLCAGRAPFSIQPYLCDASIVACRKKGGGLCSIAGGEVSNCLTSKCVSRAVQADAMVDFSNTFNSVNCQEGEVPNSLGGELLWFPA